MKYILGNLIKMLQETKMLRSVITNIKTYRILNNI